MSVQGIDVSHHQGKIDWQKVKASGIEFAIIRAGWGKDGKDTEFERNYLGCKQNAIPTGVYLYSYATTATQALAEAKHFEQLLQGKEFELPVFLDIEEKAAFNSGNSKEIVDTFCSYLESKGYYVGVYCSKAYLNSYLTNITARWCGWVAQWASKCTFSQPYTIWQKASTGRVDGISGFVDLDEFVSEETFNTIRTVIHKHGYNNCPKLAEITPEAKGHKVEVYIDGELKYSYSL